MKYSCCKKKMVNGKLVTSCIKSQNGGEDQCCDGINDVVVTLSNKEEKCCPKEKVYCRDGGTVSWDSDGVPSCPSGDELNCCGKNLCITNGKSTCCTGTEGSNDEGYCGTPSTCGGIKGGLYPKIVPGSPLDKKCIGIIKNKCDSGDENCKMVCTNDDDIFNSTFNIPDATTGKCQSGQTLKAVMFSENSCAYDSDCSGYTNINKCLVFDKKGKNAWSAETTCSTDPKALQAYSGECLV